MAPNTTQNGVSGRPDPVYLPIQPRNGFSKRRPGACARGYPAWGAIGPPGDGAHPAVAGRGAPSVSLETEPTEGNVKSDAKTPTLYPAFILLALFSLGGCFFNGDLSQDLKGSKGKHPRTAESIFREALP